MTEEKKKIDPIGDEKVELTEEKELSLAEKLEKVQNDFDELFKRRTEGTYEFKIGTKENLKLLKKYLKNGIEWKGMDAIGYVNVVNKVEEMIDDDESIDKNGTVHLLAYLMEGVSFFISQYKGVGYGRANEFVRVALPLQQTVMLMRNDDENLKKLREDIGRLSMTGDIEENETAEALDKAVKKEMKKLKD